jgi:hypothetical protein
VYRSSLLTTAFATTVALVASPSMAFADSSCVPGFTYGAFGKNSVDYGGNSGCDAWNSAAGTYAQTKSGGCDLGTDGTSTGAMTVHGTASTVFGNVYYGNGGTSSTLTVNGHPSMTNGGALPAPLSLPSVVVPTIGSNLGAYVGTGGTIAANNTYTSVSGTFTAKAGTYVIGNYSGTITVKSGAVPVLIYVTGTFAPTAINNTTGVPGNLVFMLGPNVATADLTNVGGYFAIYGPDTDIVNHGNADIYGAIVAKSFTMTGTAAIHYDKALESFSGGGFSCAVNEVSRSSPVIATLGSGGAYMVQGSFLPPSATQKTINTLGDVSKFAFPYVTGHMRARLASSIPVSPTSLSSGTTLFDAATVGLIPAPNYSGCTTFNGTCRHVFTNTNAAATNGNTFHPAMVTLSDTTATAVGSLIVPTSVIATITSTQWQTVVHTVMAGALGGVDRSTVAVIPSSTLAGSTARPTIVYFGADDGMIHAVCASTGGTTASGSNICPALGTELWAFIPRVELPLIRTNTQRIDGSPRVVDVFGDTSAGQTGLRGWRTILSFETGTGSAAAAYALDVTDPANPVLLWEDTAPTSPGTTALGAGLTSAAGSLLHNGAATDVLMLQTNNGGTGGPGVVLTAVNEETGAQIWQFGYLYPTPPRGNSADLPLPTSGIPGGPAGIDTVGQGFFTDIVMGDLYGDLWRINALDGTSRNGLNTPLFSFSTNKHPIGAPPAIYSIGNHEYGLFASGGYADPTQVSWSASTQYLISVQLSGTGPTISETTPLCSTCALAVNQTLSSGDKGFSQALIVGNQAFVTSDSADINLASYGSTMSSAHLTSVDLTGATSSTVVAIASGGSSLANVGTLLYGASGSEAYQIGTSATSTNGTRVEVNQIAKFFRQLWLRTQ